MFRLIKLDSLVAFIYCQIYYQRACEFMEARIVLFCYVFGRIVVLNCKWEMFVVYGFRDSEKLCLVLMYVVIYSCNLNSQFVKVLYEIPWNLFEINLFSEFTKLIELYNLVPINNVYNM